MRIQRELIVERETRRQSNMENLRAERRNRENSAHVIRARRDAIITENETPGNARQHWRTRRRIDGGRKL